MMNFDRTVRHCLVFHNLSAELMFYYLMSNSAEGSCRASIAVPPSARQVVLFSSGPWGERICGNAELNNAEQIPITIGKLTPYNKYVHCGGLFPIKCCSAKSYFQISPHICLRCLSWEQWEEETWTDGVTLNVTLEGGNLVTIIQS